MTNREFFTAVANGTMNDEVMAHATSAIEKLDAALLKRKNAPSKKDIENAPILEAITNALTTEPVVAADIATSVGISTQKASSLLRQLVVSGVAVSIDISVPKRGKCKGYLLAPIEVEIDGQ